MTSKINIEGREFNYYPLKGLEEKGYNVSNLPYSTKILLENLLRKMDGRVVREEHVQKVLERKREEIPFFPSRVILQDYTGVPLIVDLIAMRNAASKMGKDPQKVNPVIPVQLVADHSVQVDKFGTKYAILQNLSLEYRRNGERYAALKWAQNNFRNLKIVPPGNGIVHQVNIEFLSEVVSERDGTLLPDTLIGTDSHTTMVNGISVLGWGVGGLEAEAVMVGEPSYIIVPEVVGVKLKGQPREGITATDIVLSITEFLRKSNVVGKFVEFYGDGIRYLSTQDKATISNMSPEYGATAGFFPYSRNTSRYLSLTGRSEEQIRTIEAYLKEQGMYYDGKKKMYDQYLEFDLSAVEPSISGPANPEDRISLSDTQKVKRVIEEGLSKNLGASQQRSFQIMVGGKEARLDDGSVVIAAITSCTNTSNPDVLIGAGLVAKRAVELGLTRKPYVKTSFAPGSPVVQEYLERSNLQPYLDALGFHIVGYGCTTCIGNSGPLIKEVEDAIREQKIYTVAVLSGNRNFEGRINPAVTASFLASPMLVVAYAIAGRIDIDFHNEPLATDPNGNPVFLKDIWPQDDLIKSYEDEFLSKKHYLARKERIFEGVEEWKKLEIPTGSEYSFSSDSTYVREPPWFDVSDALVPVQNARILAIFGDRVTTDHISPAGSIVTDLEKYRRIWDELKKGERSSLEQAESPAAKYLMERGVAPDDFNSFGARRGNHEVMMRGGFSNPKIRNKMIDTPGGFTIHYPDGKRMSFFDAAQQYKKENTPLVIFAGKMYGAGSSRDWAAKATYLLDVRAVIAESFERIHRSNLTNMGVVPIEADTSRLNLKGNETVSIDLSNLREGQTVTIHIKGESDQSIEGKVRLDTEAEIEYCRSGNILNYTLKKM
ncbi:MAG: aconitate hydratase AcnA [Candidatus Thermoplasmatota archaeon]|jgi:aconitate hydratase|nr:aconitate hydratase AcnA [Candidatus Thermoplasmatota archaeon]